MPITHLKVSLKADSTNTTLVQPSDWNATHVIDIFVDNETPVGVIDGVNDTFTLVSSPNPKGSLILSVDGQIKHQDYAYTLTNNIITMFDIPSIGSNLRAWYRKV